MSDAGTALRDTARDQPEAGAIIVRNGKWGAASLADIRTVLDSVCDVLYEAFQKRPDDAIRVGQSVNGPEVFNSQRPYEMRLCATDTYWSQFVYQFAHELCHVLTNFDRCIGHRHKWFEESLCELASLYALRRASETWAAGHLESSGLLRPVEFATNHRTYAAGIAAAYVSPAAVDLPRWLNENIAALEANPVLRDLNGVVAVALLEPFQRRPALWRDCSVLNHWDAREDCTFGDYLDSWEACLRRAGSVAGAPAVVRNAFLPLAKGLGEPLPVQHSRPAAAD